MLKKQLLLLCFLLSTIISFSQIMPDWSKPVGFASISGDNFNEPVTGGANSDTVYINGSSEFTKLVTLLYDRIKAYKYKKDNLSAKYAPLTIILEKGIYHDTSDIPNTGSVWGNSMLAIQDQGDITIIGKENVILNFGINVKRSYNVIIRNITFQDYYDDGINIGEPETHHVWVDHCTFGHPVTMPSNTEHPDGSCDVKNGASYVTISWCLFRNSWKTSLVGHSDSNGTADSGRLKTTYYCNHFLNSNSRHPRVRFGEVHVLNCLYENVQLYGIAAANSAYVFAEGNFFLNTTFPMYADRSESDFAAIYAPLESYTGNYPCKGLKQINNQYDDSGISSILTGKVKADVLNPGNRSIKFDELNPDQVFDPHTYYNYNAMNVSDVKDIVSSYAGADIIDFFNNTGQSGSNNSDKIKISIYPNPASDYLTVNGENSEYLRLVIYDLSGKIFFEKTFINLPQIFNIREIGMKPGFYFAELINASEVKSLKLIIE